MMPLAELRNKNRLIMNSSVRGMNLPSVEEETAEREMTLGMIDNRS
jgi:hypothetical protein